MGIVYYREPMGFLESDVMSVTSVSDSSLSPPRVIELASEHELGLRVRQADLLKAILNAQEVHQLLTTPGRRYRGQDGIYAAASKIQVW